MLVWGDCEGATIEVNVELGMNVGAVLEAASDCVEIPNVETEVVSIWEIVFVTVKEGKPRVLEASRQLLSSLLSTIVDS